MAQLKANPQNVDSGEAIDPKNVKILIISKGFGSAEVRLSILKQSFDEKNILIVEVPEPNDSEHKVDNELQNNDNDSKNDNINNITNMKYGTNTLLSTILEFKPNVLIASSRGGKYMTSILETVQNSKDDSNNKGIKKIIAECGILLLSAMDTRKCASLKHPMLCYHATNDKINMINNVKIDSMSFPTFKLIEAVNENHDLLILNDKNKKILNKLIIESIEWLHWCQNENNMKTLQKKEEENKNTKFKVQARLNMLNQIEKRKEKK